MTEQELKLKVERASKIANIIRSSAFTLMLFMILAGTILVCFAFAKEEVAYFGFSILASNFGIMIFASAMGFTPDDETIEKRYLEKVARNDK